MSEMTKANQKEKAAKIRRKPERESVLQHTFAAARHNRTNPESTESRPPGSGLLQRQCACGMHTIAGGECSECRSKRESTLQRTAVKAEPDQTVSGEPVEVQSFPESGFAYDFSRIPVHTIASQSVVQPKFSLGSVGDQDEQGANRVAKQGVSRVKAHTGTRSDTLNRSLQARAFTTGSVQREPAPDISGRQLEKLGEKTDESGRTIESFIKAAKEIVPLQESPGQFAGFENKFHAFTVAKQHSGESYVIQDPKGLYHVFATQRVDKDKSRMPLLMFPSAYKKIRKIKPTSLPKSGGQSWSKRVQAGDYVNLLIEAVGVTPGEVHVAEGSPDKKKGGAPADSKLDVINIDFDLPTPGRVSPAFFPAEPEGEIPKPYLLIGKIAFQSGSPTFLRRSVVHELKHVRHHNFTVELIKEWRGSLKEKKSNFHEWLKNEKKADISPEDYLQARLRTTTKASEQTTAVTEIFSYLEGFKVSYHQLPEGTDQSLVNLALSYLDKIDARWATLGNLSRLSDINQKDEKKLKQAVYDQLEHYYCALNKKQRHTFDKFVKEKANGSNNSTSFYGGLMKFAGKEC